MSPVFCTVIVYVIKSPTLAISTSLPSLVIKLDLFALIIDVFVSLSGSVGSFVGSVLSSPFAIATFEIVPSVAVTFTVNLAFTVSPAGIVTTHFTPISAFSSPIVVPSATTSSLIVASSIDTKLVPCGILSFISILLIGSLLLFVTSITYVIFWPVYINSSPPTPVIAAFLTVNSGSFTPNAVFWLTFTCIGFHQSKKSSDTSLSFSSTLVIVVSPTLFTFVSVVTPVFPALFPALFAPWFSVFWLSTFSLSPASPAFSPSGGIILLSPLLESVEFSPVWVPSVDTFPSTTWFPSVACVSPLPYKNTPTDIPAASNNTITVTIAIIFFLLILIPPKKFILLLLLILVFAYFHLYM